MALWGVLVRGKSDIAVVMHFIERLFNLVGHSYKPASMCPGYGIAVTTP
jgi:hypothetical protein